MKGIKTRMSISGVPKMAKVGDTLEVYYDQGEGRPILAVTGAVGGPTPDGSSVTAHLFVEYLAIPSILSAEVKEGGVVDLAKADIIKRGDIIRELVATLLMSPESAMSLGKFLTANGKAAMKARGE